MGVEYVSSNMTAGELTPELHARVDIEKYQHGLAEATNMIILPFGGLRRRPGTKFVKHIGEQARLLPFVFSSTQKYLIVMRVSFIDIYRDNILVSTEASPYATMEEIMEVDVIQSADTMIFAHENYPPCKLIRQGSDTVWDMIPITFTNYPYKNFGTQIVQLYTNDGLAQTVSLAVGDIILNADGNAVNGANYTYYKAVVAQTSIDLSTQDFNNLTNWSVEGSQEIAWSATRGYPRTCTFFGGRLWFAGATQSPTTIWGSKINGFFDFSLGRSNDDDGIEDILDSDQFNIIRKLFNGRSLQAFTSGGEFYNSATSITPALSSWKRQTGYGSVDIKPVLIDGATLFIDSSGRNVRQFIYDFNEDSYVSPSQSILSSHLITKAVAMDAIKGTQYDVGDYVYVINEDGTVAVLNTMRAEKITGWTRWETEGEFKDVVVIDKDVYFLVYRNFEYFLEQLEEGTYTDHHTVINGIEPIEYNVISGSDDVLDGTFNVVYTDETLGTLIYSVDTTYHTSMLDTEFKVVADYSIMPSATPTGIDGDNSFTITRGAYRLEVGLNFKTKVITLPISTDTQSGATLHKRKRVVKVDINVLNSLGVYARKRYTADRQFTVVLDKAPEPFTGFKEMYLLGYDRLTSIEISQEEPLPFILRSIGFELAY